MASENENNQRKSVRNLTHEADMPGREELGHCAWTMLHFLAWQYPEAPTRDQKLAMHRVLTGTVRMYPCGICRAHARPLFARLYHPSHDAEWDDVVLGSSCALRAWLCRFHNTISATRTGGALMDCSCTGHEPASGNGGVINYAQRPPRLRQDAAPATWIMMHCMADALPDAPSKEESKAVADFMRGLWVLFPRGDMAWGKGWDAVARGAQPGPPPDSACTSRMALVTWVHKTHNTYNAALGAPQLPLLANPHAATVAVQKKMAAEAWRVARVPSLPQRYTPERVQASLARFHRRKMCRAGDCVRKS